MEKKQWYIDLEYKAKYVFDLINKYHNYFSLQDKKFKKIVRFLKVLILFFSMASTIILGLKTIIEINWQVVLGLILSTFITFTTAISSYFNFEEYWMRNISIHINLNILRDYFIFDAKSGVLDEKRLKHYIEELEKIQNNNIHYWEKAIKRV